MSPLSLMPLIVVEADSQNAEEAFLILDQIVPFARLLYDGPTRQFNEYNQLCPL